MPMYSIATQPLMNKVKASLPQDDQPKHMFYADDGSAAGSLAQLKKYWDAILEHGPKFGYFPNPKKTILVIKGAHLQHKADAIFENAGVKITTDGEKHLGAAIGSIEFRDRFVGEKIRIWVKDVEDLAKIAEEEPQLAYAAFTKGLAHRWSYTQRTIGDIGHLFDPLEDVIRHTLIPKLVGRDVSDLERDMIALPLRFGGLGIQNPAAIADREFAASEDITKELRNLIYRQDSDIRKLDREAVKICKQRYIDSKNEWMEREAKRIKEALPTLSKKRAFEQAAQKGSSSWLSALPLSSLGYVLNKRDFLNSLNLRYDWSIPGIHSHCACGKKNDINHILTCHKGGYLYFRHNVLVDAEAELLREAKCKNVYIEPSLLPTAKELHPRGTCTDDGARLDISAIGLFGRCEKTFMDVRVFHANAQSHIKTPLDKLYLNQEKEKKVKYNSRIINTEKATLVPLVFSTAGGTGRECEKYHKKVAEKIATIRHEQYADVMNHMRTKLRFALLKSVLVAIYGVRTKGKEKEREIPMAEVDFGLIPQANESECR